MAAHRDGRRISREQRGGYAVLAQHGAIEQLRGDADGGGRPHRGCLPPRRRGRRHLSLGAPGRVGPGDVPDDPRAARRPSSRWPRRSSATTSRGPSAWSGRSRSSASARWSRTPRTRPSSSSPSSSACPPGRTTWRSASSAWRIAVAASPLLWPPGRRDAWRRSDGTLAAPHRPGRRVAGRGGDLLAEVDVAIRPVRGRDRQEGGLARPGLSRPPPARRVADGPHRRADPAGGGRERRPESPGMMPGPSVPRIRRVIPFIPDERCLP